MHIGPFQSEVVDADYLLDKWFTWPLPPILLRDWGAEAAHPPKIPLAGPVAVAGPDKGGPPGALQDDGFDDPNAAGPKARAVVAPCGAKTAAALAQDH